VENIALKMIQEVKGGIKEKLKEEYGKFAWEWNGSAKNLMEFAKTLKNYEQVWR
jgi:hypothetical protein